MKWLKFHKEKWRLQRAQRRERRKLLSQGVAGTAFSDPAPSQMSATNMAGFIRQRNRALAELPWQIIQVLRRALVPGNIFLRRGNFMVVRACHGSCHG